MPDTEIITIDGRSVSYRVFGSGKIDIVIELALGAVMGEWLHIPALLPQGHTVLLYERAGVGESSPSKAPRTPESIALELKSLLDALPHEDKLTIIAHSQGGLYAQQFARLFPELTGALILLDPLYAREERFKTRLTPAEYKTSGADKFSNLGLAEQPVN